MNLLQQHVDTPAEMSAHTAIALRAITRRRPGFTLTEALAIVAVLLMIAALAGVGVPRYLDSVAAERNSAARAALGEVRAGIANFYANAAVTGEPRYPSLAELLEPGAVLSQPIASNPFKASDTAALVREATWSAAAPPVDEDSPAGWNYDPALGRFWANSRSLDPAHGGPESAW